MRATIATAVALACGAGMLPAQDSALVAALAANRMPLGITDGRLSGAGGDFLIREGRGARFTLVGEEHGVAEVPQLVAAWLRDLRPAGYTTLAIEVSPLAARRIEEVSRTPDPRATWVALFGDTTMQHQLPFYTLEEELDLLAWASSRSGGGLTIWGLDYDVWGDRYWLRRLERIVRPAARPVVTAAIARADSGFARVRRGDPSQIFSFTAPESVFVALRQAVQPEPGSEAAGILEVLERTVAINRPFLAGQNYQSNLGRVTNLKQNFLTSWREAQRAGGPTPKVLFKFGAYHMWRGINPIRMFDVGNLAASLAEIEGGHSFHIYVVGGPGTEHARFDITRLAYVPRPVEHVAAGHMGAVRQALAADGWSVFDIRPLRALIQNRRLRDVPLELEQIITGFDAIVVLTGSRPAGTGPA
jgi:hypothetical protein